MLVILVANYFWLVHNGENFNNKSNIPSTTDDIVEALPQQERKSIIPNAPQFTNEVNKMISDIMSETKVIPQ